MGSSWWILFLHSDDKSSASQMAQCSQFPIEGRENVTRVMENMTFCNKVLRQVILSIVLNLRRRHFKSRRVTCCSCATHHSSTIAVITALQPCSWLVALTSTTWTRVINLDVDLFVYPLCCLGECELHNELQQQWGGHHSDCLKFLQRT